MLRGGLKNKSGFAVSNLGGPSFFRKRVAAFTLIELLIAVFVLTLFTIGSIATILMLRNIAEYNKQRIAAMSAARTYVEERVRRDLFPTLAPVSNITLDNFNTPDTGDDLQATMSVQIFEVNTDGTRGAEVFTPPTTTDRVEVVVTVTWNCTGRFSGRQAAMTLQTYVSPDL